MKSEEFLEEEGVGFGAAGCVVDGDRALRIGSGDGGGHGEAVVAVSFDRGLIGREGSALALDRESVFGDLMFDVEILEQVGS